MQTNTLPSYPPLLEWSAHQDPNPVRGKLWYTIATCFVVLCLIFSIWTSAWTFTVLIVLVTGTYWKFHGDIETKKQIRIWGEGFAIDSTYTAWEECQGFWMLKNPAYTELYIAREKKSVVRIQTGEIDPYHIRDVIASFVQELPDQKEKLLDTIIRICKL